MPRVVLYAEGAGETGGVVTSLPAPGHGLEERHLGPAHLLARRALANSRTIGEESIRFESPLRTGRPARIAKGSDLVDRGTLRELLTWLDTTRRPDLAIVLVDRDGQKKRHTILRSYLEEPRPVQSFWILAVAIEEFEAWLLADSMLVERLLGVPILLRGPVEDLEPGEAKRILRAAIHSAGGEAGLDEKALRRRIAAGCDLGVVARACPAFHEFQTALR